MDKKNSVFIGVSLDDYIADRNGGFEWLDIIPVMLGGGTRLYSELPRHMQFELVKTRTYMGQITQAHFI